jgi:hypothetical protein
MSVWPRYVSAEGQDRGPKNVIFRKKNKKKRPNVKRDAKKFEEVLTKIYGSVAAKAYIARRARSKSK